MAGRYPQGDFFDFESELPQEEKQILYKVREWARESVLPIAVDYWNREEFPHALIPEIQDLNIISLVRGQGRSRLLAGLVAAEIHRADGSVGTFFSGQDVCLPEALNCLAPRNRKNAGSMTFTQSGKPECLPLQNQKLDPM